MADGNPNVTQAWGTAELEAFLKKLGLPTSGISIAFDFDFAMRRGDRAGVDAAARRLAELDPHMDVDTFIEMAVNQYNILHTAFQAGQDITDGQDTDEEVENPGIAEDYSPVFYGQTAFALNMREDRNVLDLLSRITAAIEAGKTSLAQRLAKTLVSLMRSEADIIPPLTADNDQIGLHPSLSDGELVSRVIDVIRNNIEYVEHYGDPGDSRDGFDDIENDPRYDPANGGIFADLNQRRREQTPDPAPKGDVAPPAETPPNPQQPAQNTAERPPRQPRAGNAPPTLGANDLKLTIDKMIEFLKSKDKRTAIELAADYARDARAAGLTSKSVKEIAASLMKTAQAKLAKQQEMARRFEEAQVDLERQTRAEQEQQRIRAERLEAADADRQRQIREQQEAAEQAQRAQDRTDDAAVALPDAVWDAPGMARAGLDFVQARERGDAAGQREALREAIEIAREATAGMNVTITPELVLQNILPPDQWPAGLSGRVAPEQTTDTQGAQADGPGAQNTLDRMQAEMHDGEVGRVDQLDAGDEDDELPEGHEDVELTPRHVSMVDWPTVSTLYGIHPDEADELEALGVRLVKKGPEDGGSARSANDLIKRSTKKKKKPKVKNKLHLVAAILDAIKRKAMKKKLTKPLKPADMPD